MNLRDFEHTIGRLATASILGKEERQALQVAQEIVAILRTNRELPANFNAQDLAAELAAQLAPSEPDNPATSSTQREVFTGYVTIDGHRTQVDFDVPVGADMQTKDAAFLAALGQIAELDYLSMGVIDTPATKPGKPGPSL